MNIEYQINEWVEQGRILSENVFGFIPRVDEVKFERNTNSAGKVRLFKNGTIELVFNLDVAEKYGNIFQDTVLHEIAHIIVRKTYPKAKQNHGKEFRYVCSKIGCSGTTHADYVIDIKTKTKKHQYNCQCQKHYVSTRKHNVIQQNPKLYSCQVCKSDIKYQINELSAPIVDIPVRA